MTLPIFISKIDIKNFQCIQHIEAGWEKDYQFIVFAGENGDGKTSILQAIASVYWKTDIDYNIFDIGGKTNKTDRNFNGYNSIKLYLKNNNETCKMDIDVHLKQEQRLSLLIGYGASRLQLQSPESQEDRSKRNSPTYSLFNNDGVFLNIEYWIKMQLLDGKKKNHNKIEAVKNALVALMPNVSEIKINGSKITYLEKGMEVPSQHLSAGHKSILAMIGDLIIRLFDDQPGAKSVSDLAGIVLIDEIEAHLHPKWQKEFPRILATTFPKVQFIVTTHSAITFLGLPTNSLLFHVKRDEKKGTQIEQMDLDIKNLLPNQILTSPLFDLENLRHIENEGIETLHVEETFDEIIKRKESKELLKNLSKNFKFTVPQ